MERAVGLHRPDVANLVNTLAGMHAELGDHAEAERLAQRPVVLMEAVMGSTEMEVLRVQSLGTLGKSSAGGRAWGPERSRLVARRRLTDAYTRLV